MHLLNKGILQHGGGLKSRALSCKCLVNKSERDESNAGVVTFQIPLPLGGCDPEAVSFVVRDGEEWESCYSYSDPDLRSLPSTSGGVREACVRRIDLV